MFGKINLRDILFGLALLLLCLEAIAHYVSAEWNIVGLYIITPLVMILATIVNAQLKVGKWFYWLCLLYAWIGITTIGAESYSLAAVELHRLIGCLLFAYIIASLAQDKQRVQWLYIIYLVLYINAIAYANRELLPNLKIGQERIASDDMLNANTISYYTFFCAFILFLFGELAHKKTWATIWNILFIGMLPMTFIVAIITASRQVILVIAPMILWLLLHRYLFSKQTQLWKKIVCVVSIITALYFAIPYAIDTYSNSQLDKRYQQSIAGDERLVLLQEAVEMGCKHPIFGLGPGNFQLHSTRGLFSHCSFTELFANHGVIGVLIYLSMLICFCWETWRRWRKTRDSACFAFWLFSIFFVFYQMFYVWYVDNWLISFFILVSTHSDTYYNQLTTESQSNNK